MFAAECVVVRRDIIHHVKSLNASNVVITGHSLGGGLAHIVGSLTGHQSIAFSPPGERELRVAAVVRISAVVSLHCCVDRCAGILESRRKFSVDNRRIRARSTCEAALPLVLTRATHRCMCMNRYHQSVSVVPDLDPFPLLDRSTSLRQQVERTVVCSDVPANVCHRVCLCVCCSIVRSGATTGTRCSATASSSRRVPSLAPAATAGSAS
jgi:hypothetical protein